MNLYLELFTAENELVELEAKIEALRQRVGRLKLLIAVFSDLPID